MIRVAKQLKSGFTLIELLCVCAIILLLTMILLPALNTAQDRAVTAGCISNERQISMTWHQYASDHDGVAIGCNWQAQSGQPDESPWVYAGLYPYGITWDIWRCPGSPKEFWKHWTGAELGTYGISFSKFTRGGPSWQDPVRMSEIAYPSTTAFLADKLFSHPPNLYTRHSMGGRAWAGMWTGNFENHPWPLHGPWLMPGIKTKTNVARADGSVRTYEYSEIVARNYVFVTLYGPSPTHSPQIFYGEAARQYLWSGARPVNANPPIRSVGWIVE